MTPRGWVLVHKNRNLNESFPLQRLIQNEGWDIHYISCDYPYIFVTYKRNIPSVEDDNVYKSGFYKDIMHHVEWIEYNPFDFTGRESNVEYLRCEYNDKTGMGVTVRDYNDWDRKYEDDHGVRKYRVKELGFTPDSILVYPAPEMYRYLVARLADKLSALNQSNVLGVAKELAEAQYGFEAFCAKDKSAWSRINNVNGPNMGDML